MANAVAVFQGWQRSARIEEIDEVNAIAGSIAAAVEEQSAATADMAGAQRHPAELRAHSERVLRCLDEFARKYSVTVTNQTDQAAASKAA